MYLDTVYLHILRVHVCEESKREREKEEETERERERENVCMCVCVAALFDHIKFINPPFARRKARRRVQKVTACRLWQPLQRVYFPDAGRVSVYEGREEGQCCADNIWKA
jgi:hypothetical protein